MSHEDYDKAEAEVSQLDQLGQELRSERDQESASEAALRKDESHDHSFLFHFETKENRGAEAQRVESERAEVARGEDEVAETEAKVNAFIQRKSALDRYVPYGDHYIALTALGVTTLSDLNAKNYRVADSDLADLIKESASITSDFEGMVSRGKYYVDQLRLAKDINLPDRPAQNESGDSDQWDSGG